MPDRPAWIVIGAPLDGAGRAGDEAAAPEALRRAGLVAALGAEDAGDAHAPITDQTRDPESGVLALDQIAAASRGICAAVDAVYGRAARPLLVGGDCSLIIGTLAGARRHHDRIGICFLDGHVDSYDGETSPTGEVADMDIGIVCGEGPAQLRGLGGAPDPLVRPSDCVVVGNRFTPEGETPDERELAHPLIQQIPGTAFARLDAGELGAAVAERLAGQTGAVWLHIDCDVLDERVMPAVSYPQSDGATWEQLEALVAAFAARPELIGASVTDFAPSRDPSGEIAQRIVGVLRRTLAD